MERLITRKMNKGKMRVCAVIAYIVLAGLGSCSKQLDKAPLDQFANEAFWASENDALLALTGVYRGSIQMNRAAEFNPTDWWSYHGLLYLEFATDNAYDRRGDNSAYHRLTNGTLIPTVAILGNYWSLSYRRIARTNYFLENVDKTPLDEARLSRFKAEARFIRACQYFYLSQYWGNVPLVTNTLTLEEANTVTKTPKRAVVDFVISELQDIVADLPRFSELPAAERGRASKQAALAFLGRTQLADRQFASAASSFKQIIDYGDNIIDPNYNSLFDGTNEGSRELIFATQYLQDFASNAMMQHNAPVLKGGWHLHCPLGSLVESYEFSDGTPFSFEDARYNPLNLSENRDPRLRYTVLHNMQLFGNLPYISHPDAASSVDQLTTNRQATRTGFGLRKFNDENLVGDLQNNGIDLPIIRYAEVLLSYLEARLEAGDAITQSLLDETINAVRGRTSVNMPPVTETDPAQLREILRRERRVELALEGIRYWDLLRWGIAHEVLNGDFYGAPYPGATNLRVKPGSQRDVHDRWFVTARAFRQGQDEHWPIPQSEGDINPRLLD